MTVRILEIMRQWIARLDAQSRKLFGAPLASAVIVGSCLVAAGLWLAEHDAQVRQAAELERMKKQTAANVSALETQAQAALREANRERAQAVAELEARERRLVADSARLGAQFAALQSKEQTRLGQVAALPASELAQDVSARLGVSPQELGGGLKKSAGEAAGLPTPPGQPSPAGAGPPMASGQVPAAATDKPGEGALRKMDSALVELDSCREQGEALGEQLKNSSDQIATHAATISQQAAAIAKLNQAIEAKDQARAESEAESRRELKAARGTRLSHLGRLVEHVAIGIAIGALLR